MSAQLETLFTQWFHDHGASYLSYLCALLLVQYAVFIGDAVIAKIVAAIQWAQAKFDATPLGHALTIDNYFTDKLIKAVQATRPAFLDLKEAAGGGKVDVDKVKEIEQKTLDTFLTTLGVHELKTFAKAYFPGLINDDEVLKAKLVERASAILPGIVEQVKQGESGTDAVKKP